MKTQKSASRWRFFCPACLLMFFFYSHFQELRKEHARELDALEQAHSDAKGES